MSVIAAPLILGTDLRTMPSWVRGIVTNRAVIALDQDSLGVQARVLFRHGDGEVLVKPLANGDRAVLLLNRGGSRVILSVSARQLGLGTAARCVWRDLWTHVGRTTTERFSAGIPPRSSVLLRVSAVKSPGT